MRVAVSDEKMVEMDGGALTNDEAPPEVTLRSTAQPRVLPHTISRAQHPPRNRPCVPATQGAAPWLWRTFQDTEQLARSFG